MGRYTEEILDELLVMDAQDGNAEAMEMLVSRWQKRLWSHAYRLTGDREATWDVTQQSWLGIIRGLGKLKDPARFGPWAFSITTNKARDWIRKRSRERAAGLDEPAFKKQPHREHCTLDELLAGLSAEKKEVVSLYYLEQMTVSQVGMALGIPAGTVKSRLHNARQQLKQKWQNLTET